ncbi:MAG TPA: PadR family transcriptional regulator [Ktedonobacterales bacterium]
MYELIVLSLLTLKPLHGYLIAKIINDIIGPYARLSNGRLYPLLAKLQADGLIAASEDTAHETGTRRQRTYAITDAGRLRLHDLMMDTTSNPGEYQRLFWLKVPYVRLLAPHERLYLVDHYITYCQTHIFHVSAEIEDMRRNGAEYYRVSEIGVTGMLYSMEHLLAQWRLELESALQWRAQMVADAEQLADAEQVAPQTDESTIESRDMRGDREP